MRLVLVSVVLVGLASVAGAADPAKTGRLPVGVVTVDAVDTTRGRTIPTELWYPAKTAGRDAAPSDRARPLVILAHGFCGARTNYEFLTQHLASHGFVVAAPDMMGITREACDAEQVTGSIPASALDLDFVCRTLHDVTGPLARYAQRVRGNPTGLVGHSLGGRIVVEAATIGAAFTANVGLAPAARAAEATLVADLTPRRAWLVMGGTADVLVDFDAWTMPFFEGLPPPAYLVRIGGGTHSGFTDVDAGLAPEALASQQASVKRYVTAFFTARLARKGKFSRWLRTRDDGTVAVTARKK